MAEDELLYFHVPLLRKPASGVRAREPTGAGKYRERLYWAYFPIATGAIKIRISMNDSSTNQIIAAIVTTIP